MMTSPTSRRTKGTELLKPLMSLAKCDVAGDEVLGDTEQQPAEERERDRAQAAEHGGGRGDERDRR